jgi:hypothetical protein
VTKNLGWDQSLHGAMQRGIKFLSNEQKRDGGYEGQAGPSGQPFTPSTINPNVFFTSLIVNALAAVQGTGSICQAGTQFLLGQRSTDWRWNYWIRDSSMAVTNPYPDDLDDTACALSALSSYDPALVDSDALGHIAHTLITVEKATGGPYRTWLTQPAANAKGSDIDVAVNANVGYMLSQHAVSLPKLNKYLSHALISDNLGSAYYVTIVPSLYFMSRWYRGKYLALLRTYILRELADTHHETNPLQLGMLISAGCNTDIPKHLLKPAAAKLVALEHSGKWAAEPLYQDPDMNGVGMYAGSRTLTTAFVIEALSAYMSDTSPRHATSTAILPVKKSPELQLLGLNAESPLHKQYVAYTNIFAQQDAFEQISTIAEITAVACHKRVPHTVLDGLNHASIDGWVAYSIYDDFLDGEGKPVQLGVANTALRRMLKAFEQAVPDPEYHQLVQRTLNIVDDANTWETAHARSDITGSDVHIVSLPDYGTYDQLAQKSAGHMLASCGVLVALGYAADGPEAALLQKYFHHYLIARQLNDDAHDWEVDIMNGHLSAVVTLILNGTSLPAIISASQIPDLRVKFWETTIAQVAALIHTHTKAALDALDACTFLHSTTVFKKWVQSLEYAATKALEERDETQKFINAFTDADPR